MVSRRRVVAGNWKLNKTVPETRRSLLELRNKAAGLDAKADIIVFPSYVCLETAVDATKDTRIHVGAQNVFWESSGAYTGEISVEMLESVGVSHVLIGHSERRSLFGETDATVAARLGRVLKGSLTPVVCVGESLEEREANRTEEILVGQVRGALSEVAPDHVSRLILAYEPVWAIGTGKTASPETANDAHALIRAAVAAIFDRSAADGISILYGGSVKPENTASLMAESEIDGVLVGGASLDPSSFAEIVRAAG